MKRWKILTLSKRKNKFLGKHGAETKLKGKSNQECQEQTKK